MQTHMCILPVVFVAVNKKNLALFVNDWFFVIVHWMSSLTCDVVEQ